MMRKSHVFALLSGVAPSVYGFNVVIDYSYDTSNFFANNATARAALEAAAQDISDLVDVDLGPVTPGAVRIDGANASVATFTTGFNINHPSAETAITLST